MGIELYWFLQILLCFREQSWHGFESRRRRKCAIPWRVVFLLQQGKDGVTTFVDIRERIRLLELQNIFPKIDFFELRTKKQPIDPIIFRPLLGLRRPHLVEQLAHVLGALGDLGGRIICQAIVPGMQTRLAAGNRIIFVPPVVIVVGEFVQRGGVRGGCFAFASNGGRGFCNQSLIGDIGPHFTRGTRLGEAKLHRSDEADKE